MDGGVHINLNFRWLFWLLEKLKVLRCLTADKIKEFLAWIDSCDPALVGLELGSLALVGEQA